MSARAAAPARQAAAVGNSTKELAAYQKITAQLEDWEALPALSASAWRALVLDLKVKLCTVAWQSEHENQHGHPYSYAHAYASARGLCTGLVGQHGSTCSNLLKHACSTVMPSVALPATMDTKRKGPCSFLEASPLHVMRISDENVACIRLHQIRLQQSASLNLLSGSCAALQVPAVLFSQCAVKFSQPYRYCPRAGQPMQPSTPWTRFSAKQLRRGHLALMSPLSAAQHV